jgi:hypothetical protein
MVSGAQKMRPVARISVVEGDDARRKHRNGYICRDQVDIKYRHAVLPAFFFRRPPDRLIDLMRITATVAHTDRRICRRPSVCWERDLEVSIPVSDPEFWSSEIAEGLVRLLNLLSGDSWNFVFHKSAAEVQLPRAAVAAAQSEGDIVVIPESGQGSLGPWLTVTGQESPDIRTHPIFTSALAKVLEPILGRRIRFEHPHLWETKGQTLSRLVTHGLQSGWQDTFSCAVQVRHQQTPGRRLQCGLCPNCLLRRQSLWAAGLNEPDNEYDYRSGPSEDESHDSKESKALRRRVAEGLLSLIEFAQLKSVPLFTKTADRQIARFATAVQADVNDLFPRNVQLKYEGMAKRTGDVVENHRHELINYLASRPSGSLMRQLGNVLL